MSAFVPLQLEPADKLDALRYLDEFHFWHSLDEERLCQCCGCACFDRFINLLSQKFCPPFDGQEGTVQT
jgi:hypothetical protein